MSMEPNSESWLARRSRFNHDRLKNSYIRDLGAFKNTLVEGEVEDEHIEATFVTQRLPRWEEHAQDARALIDRFEVEMTPTRHLAAGADGWVRAAVERMWRASGAVDEAVATARAAVLAADETYAAVRSAGSKPTGQVMTDFHAAVCRVATAFEAFPRVREFP